MTTKLIQHGSGWALPLDDGLVKGLNLGPEQEVEVVLESQGATLLVGAPHKVSAAVVKYATSEELAAARQEIHARYHDAFQELAK